MTAGTRILAFILHEPLIAVTGITPEEGDPLLDIHKVTQNCNSLYQHNRIPGDILQILGLHPLGFCRCSYHLKRVTLVPWDSRSPLDTTTGSASEKRNLESHVAQLPWFYSFQTEHTHVNVHLTQLTDHIWVQLRLVAAGITNQQCPSSSVPCKHSGLAMITLKAIGVQDHYQPSSCSYTLRSDSMKVVWGWGREERGV